MHIEPPIPTWIKWMIGIFAMIGLVTTLNAIDNSPLGRWWNYGDNSEVAGGALMLLGILISFVYVTFFGPDRNR